MDAPAAGRRHSGGRMGIVRRGDRRASRDVAGSSWGRCGRSRWRCWFCVCSVPCVSCRLIPAATPSCPCSSTCRGAWLSPTRMAPDGSTSHSGSSRHRFSRRSRADSLRVVDVRRRPRTASRRRARRGRPAQRSVRCAAGRAGTVSRDGSVAGIVVISDGGDTGVEDAAGCGGRRRRAGVRDRRRRAA